ncbi:hypothetical protein DICPUDRAFT_40129 [Dictyostelium purpureum]|uniref:DNA/RNA-binding protein Kin17 WH-like domain-containing protein n=1 Tax=Dictyostelium purpureum TaxID=5786 RepID=F0ZXM2_DICPU|nr:uncharacterized protein DICPUDRAFT_40129 [Dictyostelium purpureum]EGC31313.1 hypothetical protein DICPUDRAFT_40129 [Dictyostelium purpureum]|eukprot:XP_003292157.1 hypothetical protein DICPUDRAFT_40129 [Dictyostelium purpureum]
MGKAEALTPKAIANKIKAKGLQKLRWYCQLCQKQCRDENGFKCHIDSEGHQRQMEVFSGRSNFIVDQYSKEFEEDFIRLLSRQYLNSKVSANQVYSDYIKDRHHVHMNSTQWTTLSEFVKYLGKTSKCIVEETPKGWLISYINRDPAYINKKENEEKKEKMEILEEERQKIEIEKRLKELNKFDTLDEEKIKPSELTQEDKEQLANIGLTLKTNSSKLAYDKNIFVSTSSSTNDSKKISNDETNPKPYAKKLTAMEEIMLKEKEKQEFQKRKDQEKHQNTTTTTSTSTTNTSKKEVPWIIKDIVVKIVDKQLSDGKYYKKKGYIMSVENEFLARVKLLDTSDILKIDQIFLETVIPQVGSEVMVLNGKYRGKVASMKDVNFEKFNATLKLSDGTTLTLPYEDFSKLY